MMPAFFASSNLAHCACEKKLWLASGDRGSSLQLPNRPRQAGFHIHVPTASEGARISAGGIPGAKSAKL